jgi:hypothetical protein
MDRKIQKTRSDSAMNPPIWFQGSAGSAWELQELPALPAISSEH